MKRLQPAAPIEKASTEAAPPSFLGELLGDQLPTTTVEPSSSGFIPYVSFYSGREGNRGGALTSRDIAEAIPGITIGQPYLRNGDDLKRLDVPVVLVDLFTFYGTRDSDNDWECAGPDDSCGKPAAIAALLCVFEDEVIPAVCETNGKAKSSWAFKYAQAQQKAGKRLQARIGGTAKHFDKKLPNGKTERIEYTQTMARTSPVDEETARKLAEFAADGSAEERVQALRDEFASRADAVRALFD
jgi:hypothetical protein